MALKSAEVKAYSEGQSTTYLRADMIMHAEATHLWYLGIKVWISIKAKYLPGQKVRSEAAPKKTKAQ